MKVALLLVVAMFWLFVNLRAQETWLKLLSLAALLGFAGFASALTLLAAIP